MPKKSKKANSTLNLLNKNSKMLTINQVRAIYEEGVDITLVRGPHPQRCKGTYDGEIRIYTKSMRSKRGRHIIILHEVIHARNDLLNFRRDGDRLAQREAIETYNKRPAVLGYIEFLWRIK